MAQSWQSMRENVFGVFYVMTEQSNFYSRNSRWGSVRVTALFLVDAGQVLKALFLKEYGWTTEFSGVAENFDLFSCVLNIIPHPYISPGIFFVSAVAIVIIGFSISALAMHVCQSGRTTRYIWPVKMLRFLVATLVTTFFLTTLRLLLFPLECPSGVLGDADTLSQWIKGAKSPCEPWAIPEVAITLPSLTLAAAFVLFSLTSTLLSFEVNPISENPGDCFGGRIEALWSTVRVSVVVIKIIHRFITPVASLVLLSIHATILVWAHLETLPFHDHFFNMLRGGIYAMVLWISFASAIVSATIDKDSASDGAPVVLQWIMVALAPVSFFLGLVLVERRRDRAQLSIRILRAELAREQSAPPSSSVVGGSGNSFGARRMSVFLGARGASSIPLVESNGGQPRRYSSGGGRRQSTFSGAGGTSRSVDGASSGVQVTKARRRDAYSEFFDTNSRMSRAFDNARSAHLIVRILLYEKDQRDFPLMSYLFQRALEEHPNSHELQILNLIFLRFVFQDKASALLQEKVTRMVNTEQPIDLKYTLYAVERKVYQLEYGQNLGKDSISAINMIEFSTKIDHVRKQNQECMSTLKDLWKKAANCKREFSQDSVKELVEKFKYCSHLIFDTEKCYDELVEKFGESASLRRSFAEFCDVVLNDATKAELHRHAAELLEAGDEIADHDGDGSRSRSNSSSNVSYRTAQTTFVKSWCDTVMAPEVKSLSRLKALILGLGSLLFTFSLMGFLLMEVYLYQGVTEDRLGIFQRTRGYRQNMMKACISIRDLHLVVNPTDATVVKTVSQTRSSIQSMAQSLNVIHTLNYVESPTARMTEYFMDPSHTKRVCMPGNPGNFVERKTTFWDMGNDLVMGLTFASQIVLSDLRNSDFSINSLSANKRAVVFIYENVWAANSILNGFLNVVLEEISYLEVISSACAGCLLAVNAVLISVIGFFVLRSASAAFPSCQHGSVCCGLVYALPLSVIRKVSHFYMHSERRMAAIEDEDEARETLLRDDDDEREAPATTDVGDTCELDPALHDRKTSMAKRGSQISIALRSDASFSRRGSLMSWIGLPESAMDSGKEEDLMLPPRKVAISFVDSVGEVLRKKLQAAMIAPSADGAGGEESSGDATLHHGVPNPMTAQAAAVQPLTAENLRRHLRSLTTSPTLGPDPGEPKPPLLTQQASSPVDEPPNSTGHATFRPLLEATQEGGPLCTAYLRQESEEGIRPWVVSERPPKQILATRSEESGSHSTYSSAQSAQSVEGQVAVQASKGCEPSRRSDEPDDSVTELGTRPKRDGDVSPRSMASSELRRRMKLPKNQRESESLGRAVLKAHQSSIPPSLRTVHAVEGPADGSETSSKLMDGRMEFQAHRPSAKEPSPCLKTPSGAPGDSSSSIILPAQRWERISLHCLARLNSVNLPALRNHSSKTGTKKLIVTQRNGESSAEVSRKGFQSDIPRVQGRGTVEPFESEQVDNWSDEIDEEGGLPGLPRPTALGFGQAALGESRCSVPATIATGAEGGSSRAMASFQSSHNSRTGVRSRYDSGWMVGRTSSSGSNPGAIASQAATKIVGSVQNLRSALKVGGGGGSIGKNRPPSAGGTGGGSGGSRTSSKGWAWAKYEAATMYEEDADEEFARCVAKATVGTMKWYFWSSFHCATLLVVLVLCFCAWLVPLRILPYLINTTRLSLYARNGGAYALQCVFLARELVLRDGLSRLTATQTSAALLAAENELKLAVRRLRLGGGDVKFGADSLASSVMDRYQNIMYQPGCSWRANSSDCSLRSRPQAASQGLYKLLVAIYLAVDVIQVKYPATPDFAYSSSLERVVTNSSLVKRLAEDPDLAFLLEKSSQDAVDGLAMVASILGEEQNRLLSQLHEQNQALFTVFLLSVVAVFYMVLYRTTLAASLREVDNTRAFILRLPAHALTREELCDVRTHFLPAGARETDHEE